MPEILSIPHEQAPHWTAADRSFLVESIATVRMDQDLLRLEAAPVTPYVKTYLPDAPADTECHVAFVEGKAAGELRCGPHWNGYLYVHDLVVGTAFRRQGVGAALVRHAMERARRLALAGVALETQNTNWPACHLYARCGFQLGGFDRYLYRALEPASTEIALFWYWASR